MSRKIGMMALSTFFTEITIDVKSKADNWLKRLFIIRVDILSILHFFKENCKTGS